MKTRFQCPECGEFYDAEEARRIGSRVYCPEEHYISPIHR